VRIAVIGKHRRALVLLSRGGHSPDPSVGIPLWLAQFEECYIFSVPLSTAHEFERPVK
jgi:hypothetical protein